MQCCVSVVCVLSVCVCVCVCVCVPAFANWSSKRVEEHTPPLSGPDARLTYEGFKKGIQGHLNSCYLDASLFR